MSQPVNKRARISRNRDAGAGIRLAAPYTEQALTALAARFSSPLLFIDCNVIRRQYRALASALPGVDLHYALKPLPDLNVVKVLAGEGAWFDLATNGEVDLVRAAGIAPERCIHTHPIKRDLDIRRALDFGVTIFVVDNPDEIAKFTPYRDRARLLLRVAYRSTDAQVDLSRKFGCDPEGAVGLAGTAARAGVAVIGLTFHVGSQVRSADAHVRAIEICARLIAEAAGRGLPPFSVLDIGGGFPIDYLQPAPAIDRFCAPIRAALAALPRGVRVIAEPGRYICGPAGFCLTTVMGRSMRDGRWWYYLDDGMYGSFSGQLYDQSRYPVELVKPHAGPKFPCVLAGPTCDSIDVIAEDIPMPELAAGDLLMGRQMGAYTSATATDFNFFPRAHVLVVNVTPAGD
ncbi:MAG: type III PLP-dependent enzyme [Gammaproteobacteria bacterium]|nr:type III PLP-dependent enzyme [Gammaproteobacteria bacterium]